MNPSIAELKETEKALLIINSALLKKLAGAKGVSITCCECRQPLTDCELREAIDEDIKTPACDDCLQDFVS